MLIFFMRFDNILQICLLFSMLVYQCFFFLFHFVYLGFVSLQVCDNAINGSEALDRARNDRVLSSFKSF
jgi:hypothetical protein